MVDFAQILIRASDLTQSAFDSATRNMRGLQGEAGRLNSMLAKIGAGVSVAGLALYAKSTVDFADNLNDMSQRLGVSVKDLASFKLAAEQSGTSLDGVGTGIAKLTKSIGEAEGGNKNMAKALRDLGITARDPKEAFFQLADAVQRIEDPSQRAALLSQVLGKSYGELVPLLGQGGAELRKSAQASESFADAMDRLAPNADELNDMLAELKQNSAGFAAQTLSNVLPALNQVSEAMREAAREGGLLQSVWVGLGGLGAALYTDTFKPLEERMAKAQRALADARRNGARDDAPAVIAAKQQIALLEQQIAAEQRLADQRAQQKKTPAALPGGIDLSAASKSTSKGPDLESMRVADIGDAWKEADAELKRYAEDRAFVFGADLDRENEINAIAKAWSEAGEALTRDMLTPTERFEQRLEYINELFRRGKISQETLDRATAEAFDSAGASISKATTFAERFGDSLKENIEDAAASARNFGDLITDIGRRMASVFAKEAGTYASSAITDFFFKPSANGNVFMNAPALSAYSGSVVSSPTVFPFANGIGLMGEAGAEAILPLKRGRDGKLGVAMDGGGGGYVDARVYNIDARGAEAGVEQRIQRAIAESEDRAVNRAVGQVQSLNQRGQLRLS